MRILPPRRRRLRLAVLTTLVLALFAYSQLSTWWWPRFTSTTAHYVIRSAATPEETERVAGALEALHAAYSEFFADLPGLKADRGALNVRLYRDRQQFRRVNPNAGWAEAFYRGDTCHAYYAATGASPYHWMLHEATHQLNSEAAGLRLRKWLDEGLATYFGTSRYRDGALRPGQVDADTYPVWWVYEMRLTGDLSEDTRSGQIIPLRAIITGQGGPDISRVFNLYYIHWWSLGHFLLEGGDGRHRPGCLRLMREGGSLAGFEQHIGPVEQVEAEWYEHLRDLHRRLVNGEFEAPAGAA